MRTRLRTFQGGDGRWGARIAVFSHRGGVWRLDGAAVHPAVSASPEQAIDALRGMLGMSPLAEAVAQLGEGAGG